MSLARRDDRHRATQDEVAAVVDRVGQLVLGQLDQQLVEPDLHLEASRVEPEAHVHPEPEAKVLALLAVDVELVRALPTVGIAVAGALQRHHFVAIMNAHAANERFITARVPWHRVGQGLPAVHLFERLRNQRGICDESSALAGCSARATNVVAISLAVVSLPANTSWVLLAVISDSSIICENGSWTIRETRSSPGELSRRLSITSAMCAFKAFVAALASSTISAPRAVGSR